MHSKTWQRRRNAFTWVVLALTTFTSRFECAEQPSKNNVQGSLAKEEEILDVVDTVKLEQQYIPAYNYAFAILPDGRVAAVKVPEAFPEKGPTVKGQAAFFLEHRNPSWSELSLPGWDPDGLPGITPRPESDSLGSLSVIWGGRAPTLGPGDLQILAQRLLDNGSWSEIFGVSDDKAIRIESFDCSSSAPTTLDCIWTDRRDRKFAGISHPTIEGFAKLFERTLVGNRLSDVYSFNSPRGRQQAYHVKLRSDKTGNLFAIWEQSGPGNPAQIYLSMRHGGLWSQPIQISKDRYDVPITNSHSPDGFDLVPMGDGGAAVIWSRNQPYDDIAFGIFRNNKVGPVTSIVSKGSYPRATGSGGGDLALVYENSAEPADGYSKPRPPVYQNRHLYLMRFTKGQWSQPIELDTDVFLGSAAIGIDRAQRLHLLWQKFVSGRAQLIHRVQEPM